jgi:hypothetical protein
MVIGVVVIAAERSHHGAQGPRRRVPILRGEVGEHPPLDRAHGGAGGGQVAAALRGEARGLHPADRLLRRAGDDPVALEGLQQHVHRLARDEGAAREVGVRGSGPLGEELEARVVRDGHAEGPEGLLHRLPQGARRLLEEVAERGREVDAVVALTHVSILTYAPWCQEPDMRI